VAELLPPEPQLGLFLTAALILAITPGPGVFYIVASSLEGGTRAGLLSVCGIAVGTLCHILFAAIGLTALIASLPQAFIALKYAGAVYLVYLGVRVFRVGASVAMRSPSRVSAGSLARVRQAIIVNVLNPKVGIFFLAFLPQFIDPARGSAAAQFILLGLMLTALASITDGLYAVLSSHLTRLWDKTSHARRWPHRVAGCTYLMLGVASVLLEPPKI